MRLHRFIGNFDLDSPSINPHTKRGYAPKAQNLNNPRYGVGVKITNPEIVDQVIKVFRLKIGDSLILADGKKNEAVCHIEKIDKKYMEVFMDKKYKNKNEPKNLVILYCSVLKKENFEWVAQKATEVGVSEIVPIISARTIKLNLNPGRLQKIIREAAEQSGRGLAPLLRDPISFSKALEKSKENGLNLFFDKTSQLLNLKTFKLKTKNSYGVFIGPEGGWTEEEKTAAQDSGCQIVNLGSLTLRAETAAVVASFLVCR